MPTTTALTRFNGRVLCGVIVWIISVLDYTQYLLGSITLNNSITHLYVYISYMNIYIYIYIFIEEEREDRKEGANKNFPAKKPTPATDPWGKLV